MPKPPDKVQLQKQESSAGGGDDADNDDGFLYSPLDPAEDAIDVAGVYLQEDTGGGVSSNDKVVVLYREGNEMYMEDSVNAGASRVSLSALLSGFNLDTILVDDVTGTAMADDVTGNIMVDA